MRRSLDASLLAVFVWSCCSLSAAGAVGDGSARWIVLHDGQRIETQNGFEIDGRRVLFTDALGSLRSMLLAEVDVEASRRSADESPTSASEAAVEAKEDPRPVLVLENKDLPSADEAQRKRSREEAAQRRRALDRAAQRSRVGAGEARAGRPDRPRRPRSQVVGTATGLAAISHWSSAKSRQTGGLRIVGAVVNPSGRNLDHVTISVLMHDKEGELVHTGRAFVDQTRLQPGATSNFHYVDPGLASLEGLTVEFRVTARALSWGSRPRTADADIPVFRPGEGG